jgi:hypothetical protein
MKSENRKVQMTLLGVLLATPFLVIASVVGAHITSLADNVRVDVLCVALAFVSIAVKIFEGRFVVRSKTEYAKHGYVEPEVNTNLRGESHSSLSW